MGSLLLGLYDDKGYLNHVGFTSGIPKADRPSLTKKLKKLIHEPGFTGNAPGGYRAGGRLSGLLNGNRYCQNGC